MRGRSAVLIAVLAAAGCASVPVSLPAVTVSKPAAGSLAPVADEGHVTYSVTLRPGQCHTRDSGRLPDAACTPGSTDPAVTQATVAATICKTGWTATVRPSTEQTDHAKFDVSAPAYSLPPGTVGEEDHLVPLELGGSNDITNLWLEAGKIPNPKDAVENRLRGEVCAGKITLARARAAIAVNWETAP